MTFDKSRQHQHRRLAGKAGPSEQLLVLTMATLMMYPLVILRIFKTAA
jgi:hypothetical protein